MIIQPLKWAAYVLLLSSFASAQIDASAVLGAERIATGGEAWKRVRALLIDGSVTEGDVAMKLHRVIDLATGRSQTRRQAGRYVMFSGFDSVAWNASSGIVNSVDLPSLLKTHARELSSIAPDGDRQMPSQALFVLKTIRNTTRRPS